MTAPKDGHDGRLGHACLTGALGLDHAHLTGALRRKCLADWFVAELEQPQHDVGAVPDDAGPTPAASNGFFTAL